MDTERNEIRKVPVWFPVALLSVVAMAALGASLGTIPDFAAAAMVILTDGIIAMLVLTAAGGFGWAVLRFFRLEQSPTGASRSSTLFYRSTAAALGLWMLSTAVLIVGSSLPGTLTMHFWWPVVGAGVILAVVMSRRRFTAHRPLSAGSSRTPIAKRTGWQFTTGSLLWILPAMAGGLWLAGAVMPPGWLGNLTMDSYDVLEYHLQLPREYYHAGQVATLNHNVYSHYPLGTEMLFLLGMCLRGGAYEGMHLAKMIPGLFGVIMVAGVYGGIGCRTRSRAAVVLLATSPWVIYLSGLAMAETAQFCYLALAMLWLRRWLGKPSAREAVIIGAMLGGACAVKYLSVGLVAGPVLAAMLIASVARPRCPGCRRRITHVILAGGVAVLLFSPWLVRNTAATGNPVFPLAMDLFGQGHFSDESAARWRDGHAPGYHQPVPVPPDYKLPEQQTSRSERFFAFLSGREPYGTQPAIGAGVLALAVITVLAMFLRPRKSQPWEWAILGVLLVQTLVWAFFTRDMPGRFIAPAIVPLSLLAAGGLGRLARAGTLRKAIVVVLLVAAGGWNLASAWSYLHDPLQHRRWGQVDIPGPTMLIGEVRAFYFPPHSAYATVFDEHPLVGILRRSSSPDEVAEGIRRMGVTHVLVSWVEIDRLTHSYGWSAEMSAERLRGLFSGWNVVDDLSTLTLYSLERQPALPD
ncbi:MAG: glycosyltransferase family 39 protein [Phycisphaerae bacterium]|nr:glycosyltransferase family 39 protein [Phycisphaerae bacterium]